MEAPPLEPKIMELMNSAVDITIHSTRWVPNSARIVVLGAHPRGTGALKVYELKGSKGLEMVHDVQTKLPLKCSTFGASGVQDRQLATGGSDGDLCFWDLERPQQPLHSAEAHVGIVNCIDGAGCKGGGPPEVATGGEDGAVRIWDTRQRDAPVAAFAPATAGQARNCWAVGFGDCHTEDDRCLLAGYDNGDIKMFDLRTNSVRWEETLGNGVCGVAFDRPSIAMNKIMVATLQGLVHVFDVRTRHPTTGFAQTTVKLEGCATAWGCWPLPQNRDLFMVTTGSGSQLVYKYHYPDQRRRMDLEGQYKEGVPGTTSVVCKASPTDQPIITFDWSSEKQGLFCSGSFDQRLRVGTVTLLSRY